MKLGVISQGRCTFAWSVPPCGESAPRWRVRSNGGKGAENDEFMRCERKARHATQRTFTRGVHVGASSEFELLASQVSRAVVNRVGSRRSVWASELVDRRLVDLTGKPDVQEARPDTPNRGWHHRYPRKTRDASAALFDQEIRVR